MTEYTQVPGSGTLDARFRRWDPVKGYTWTNQHRDNGGGILTPPSPSV